MATNQAQVESWDGSGGEHWVAEAERYDRMNAAFGARIVDRLSPQPGDDVLDVGCGNGALALAIAPRVAPAGSVTGLDISGPMLRNAESRVGDAGLANVSFIKGDAQVHPLPESRFDAVVSRFGVMFFDDPIAAFANLCRAIRPGGRVVFACWQELIQNEWLMVPAGAALQHVPMPDLGAPGGPGPFSLADPERVRKVLGGAGLVDVELEDVTLPMPLARSVDDALAFMQGSDIGQTLMKGVDAETAERAWAAVREALEPRVTERGVELNGTAWLVTARRAA